MTNTITRRIAGAAVASLALLAVAACGSGSGGDSGSGTSGDDYEIGVVHFSSTDAFAEAVVASYTKYADTKGWKVSEINPEGSVDKAISAINNLVSKKVDLIVTETFPSDQLTAGIRVAKAAGIPVVSIGGGIVDGVVGAQDFGKASGEPTSQQMVKDLGGKGELLQLVNSGALPCKGRREAFDEALKGTSIKVTRQEVPVPGQVEAGQQFAQAFVARHPAGAGPLAVWGCWDDPAVGAINTLKRSNRTDVKIYGINGSPDALKAVEAGSMRATTYTDPVETGEGLGAKTPDFIKGGVDMKPVTLPVPNFLVTSETLADFNAKYPGVMPK